ncbi:MAG: sensor histidine kinase [Solirubrobacteraceae bacterium]
MTRAAIAATVLAFGAVAETLAPSSSLALTALDFVVGGLLGVGGAWLAARAPRPAFVAIAFSVAWFLGTLAGASSGVLSGIGSACLLAYRGPLLQLLLGMPTGYLGDWRTRALAAGCWIASLLPLAAARPATITAAAVIASVAAGRSRRAPANRRRPLLAGAAAAAALGGVWALALVPTSEPTTLLVLDDLAVVTAGSLALVVAAGIWKQPTASALVVELGGKGPVGQPIAARLARVLADPALEIRYRVPGLGWVDEQGRAREQPNHSRLAVTRAQAPTGGEVALIHGALAVNDPGLAEAAAAAAALALDGARLEAQVRASAAELRTSRPRLLTVADAERRALEARLSDEVLAPLRSVERLLQAHPDRAAVISELRDAITEVTALGRGLYPPALVRADLEAALDELLDRCPADATIEVRGDLTTASEHVREAAWFVCSEALANVARHAHAGHVTVRAVAGDRTLQLEISDDGRGGATITRGLRGLADRVEALGGTLTLDSPPGGPTAVRADLPLETQGAPR